MSCPSVHSRLLIGCENFKIIGTEDLYKPRKLFTRSILANTKTNTSTQGSIVTQVSTLGLKVRKK